MYLRVMNPWNGEGSGKEESGGSLELPCTLIRSGRRTWSAQVKEDGQIILRIPYGMSDEEAMVTAGRHGQWIAGHYKRAVDRMKSRREYSEEEIAEYKKRLRPVLEERTAFYAGKLGVSYQRIAIRAQKTRWGSCSIKGNLNFNWKLALAPPEILDYVVVHELAHRIEMNHSPRFWQQVAGILPDYKARRYWLKENGSKL